MNRWVEIEFTCLPLRHVTRLDAPLDASPAFRALWERIKAALGTHGAHNTYYLYNGACVFHLTNRPEVGTLAFDFEGVAFTDDRDARTRSCVLEVKLRQETCDWLHEGIVQWFGETVPRAVEVEFDRYIEAGDLDKARRRIEEIEARSEESGGYMGMYV